MRESNPARLVRLLRELRHHVLLSLVFATGATALAWSLGLLTKHVVDHTLSPTSVDETLRVAAIVGLALVVKALLGYGRARIRVVVGTAISRQLGDRYLGHILRIPLRRLEDLESSSDLAAKFAGHRDVREAVADVMLSALLDTALTALSIAVLLWIDPTLTLATLASLAVLPLVAVWSRRAVRDHRSHAYAAACRTMGNFVDVLIHPKTVRGFGVEEWARRRVADAHHEELRWEATANEVEARGAAATELGASLTYVVVLLVGAVQVADGRMTAGDLMLFFGLAGNLIGPAQALAGLLPALQRAAVAWDAIAEVLAIPEEPAGSLAPREIVGAIGLEDVGFAYGDAPVLANVSLQIPAGSVVAIVGESGSGKTTLVNLIAGIYRPTTGRITIDGTDLGLLDRSTYTAALGIVFQRTHLYTESLQTNVALGRADIDTRAVSQALETAQAGRFVRRLPAGEATVLHHDRGLSGGEAQRIGIARALAGDPSILILDEATSSLDSATEAAVLAALGTRSAGRTTIVVAHRLSTIRAADHIVVLANGRIAEQGSHRELVGRRGKYYELLRRQLGDGHEMEGAA